MKTIEHATRTTLLLMLCIFIVITSTPAKADLDAPSSAGLWEDMKEAAETATEKVKETVKEKLYDASETFDEVQDWTIERVGEILENFSAYKPVIKEAGFEVGEIAVEVGLIPKLIVTFKQLERINEEKKNEMLEE
jgi:hypothetical protein